MLTGVLCHDMITELSRWAALQSSKTHSRNRPVEHLRADPTEKDSSLHGNVRKCKKLLTKRNAYGNINKLSLIRQQRTLITEQWKTLKDSMRIIQANQKIWRTASKDAPLNLKSKDKFSQAKFWTGLKQWSSSNMFEEPFFH